MTSEPHLPRASGPRFPAALLLALFTLSFAGVFAWRNLQAPAPQSLPTFQAVPAFALTERSQQNVSLAQLKGHVWVADFIFTTCQAECPLMNVEMGKLAKKFGTHPKFKLVSFSVDPEHDTPQVLSQYADQLGASPTGWWFVTGPRQALYDLAIQGFKLPAQDVRRNHSHDSHQSSQSNSQPFIHSQKLILIDAQGQIRGYYDGTNPAETERLIADLPKLLPANS